MVVSEVFGSHVITINGYSRTKVLLYGESFSIAFTAAGHRWCLKYYPCSKGYDVGWISMYLNLADEGSCYNAPEVKARFRISLLDWNGNAVPSFTHASQWTHWFTTNYMSAEKGFPKFIKKKVLEQPAYLRGDCFRVRCDITVVKDTTKEDPLPPPAVGAAAAAATRFILDVPPAAIAVFEATEKKEDSATVVKETNKEEEEDAAPHARFVAVPPSDMHRHLGDLLLGGEGADVMLEVDGEIFRAHRLILAARSPVFKAELFSPKEGASTCVSVKDIEPRVFKAMLHFIYTDSLPDVNEGEAMAMAQRLLVAGDGYGLERLKLICEDKLCDYIGTSSAGTVLALAEQHGCVGLKKACLKFLMAGSNLKAAIATDGFDHLTNSCPSVLKELLAKVAL